jgi:hypothetical protein
VAVVLGAVTVVGVVAVTVAVRRHRRLRRERVDVRDGATDAGTDAVEATATDAAAQPLSAADPTR